MRNRENNPAPLDADRLEALRMRAHAETVTQQIRAQQPEVDALGSRLNLRRVRNHFGEDIEVTFRPRGNHA